MNKSAGAWYYYDVDLRDYQGQDIYVAIVHFACSNQFMLNIDDVMLYRTYDDVAEVQDTQVSIFPNPASDRIRVENVEKIESYELYDMMGALVRHQNVDSKAFDIDVNELPSGTYFININQGHSLKAKRFIKK